MIGAALMVGLATLLCGLLLAVSASRLPTVKAQLAALVATAVGLPLVGVLVGGPMMLPPPSDVVAIGAVVAASSAALVGAWLIARRLLRPLHALQAATARVAEGDLSAFVAQPGASRELRDLSSGFNLMTERLRSLHDTRSQLTAWVSHDLRTPIAALQAMVEATQDGLVGADHYLDAMQDQLRALGAMVDDLFDLAQLQVRAEPVCTEPVAIADLVDRCCRAASAQAGPRKITIDQAAADDLAPVSCCAAWIERVIQNLLRNALTHSPRFGHVLVEVLRATDEITIAVNDTGPGLSPEARRRMFEHFWRGDVARSRDGSGAGLGLAIARGLVEAHGGRIWAESRIHGGARVAFTLPIRR